MLQGALGRWSVFWKDAVRHAERYQQIDMDYVKVAPEIAVLLGQIVDMEVNGRNGALSYFRGTIHYNTRPVHELIKYVSV